MTRLARAAALAAAFLPLTFCKGEADKKRPNVLLLVMDTARADRCSVTGYDRPTTPRLDEFAKDAVTYADAWAPCCWTSPSHASLFTGLRVEHHGVNDANRPFLDASTPSVLERFHDAGWRTGLFSNNDWVTSKFGFDHGVERPDLHELCFEPSRPYPFAPATHRSALKWAKDVAETGKPFFLFINDIEPHVAYEPPQAFADKFVRGNPSADVVAAARAFNFPSSVGFVLGQVPAAAEKLKVMSDLYDAEIATLDAAVGDLLDGLRKAGLLDDTIVVICSDHGENLGEHGRLGHFLSLHRTVLRVPLVIRFPGKLDGGKKVADVVRLEDVAPTLLDLCGLPALPNADGKSLVGDVSGRVAIGQLDAQLGKMPEMSERYPKADLTPFKLTFRSIYDGKLHYVRVRDQDGADFRGALCHEELFDVSADPEELHDLAPTRPADVERLRRLLDP